MTFLIQASIRYEAHANPQDHGALAVNYYFLFAVSVYYYSREGDKALPI